jgi:hypothetical protein
LLAYNQFKSAPGAGEGKDQRVDKLIFQGSNFDTNLATSSFPVHALVEKF